MKDPGAELGLDVGTLFDELRTPSPSENKTKPTRGFVVNRQAGNDLCSLLGTATFMALSAEVQLRVASLLYEGLSASYCSVVRLRLSCEGGRLVWKLLDLLRRPEFLLRFDTDRAARRRAAYHSPVNFDPERFRREVLEIFCLAIVPLPPLQLSLLILPSVLLFYPDLIVFLHQIHQ